MKFTKVDAMERFKRKFQGDTTTKTPKTNSDLGGGPQDRSKVCLFFVFKALGPSCSLGFFGGVDFWQISMTFSKFTPQTQFNTLGQKRPAATKDDMSSNKKLSRFHFLIKGAP